MNENLVHAHECRCLSWRPIIAGTLVVLGLSFLLNLFSVAIGLTAFTTNNDGVEAIAFGGLIGTAVGIVASMFAAGWLTGYLAQRHCTKRHIGALYGFLTWCLALIVAVFLASHIKDYLSFYTHFLSGTQEVVVSQSTGQSEIAVAAHTSVKNLAISTYIVFALFFLSAFACSLGGHCGMRHVCKNENC